MKKKTKSKSAASKQSVRSARSSKNSAVPEPQLPDLVSAMMKIAERLESLEKKMETVISQTSRGNAPRQEFQQNRPQQNFNQRSDFQQNRPQHFNQQPQRQHNQHAQHQPRPVPQPNQSQNQSGNQAGPQNPGRSMYPAVCTDCGKACEVPFKPTGERPTYCKECFTKRKSGGNQNQGQKPNSFQPQSNQNQNRPMEPRVVKVTSNGVGKVTIREMVPAGAAASEKGAKKKAKPAKRGR